jgi:hypothetical protein
MGAAMSDTESISPALQKMIDKSEMITAESWAAARDRVHARREERAERLFGDRPRFFIPDTDEDPGRPGPASAE